MIIAIALALLALLLFSLIFGRRYGMIWAILGTAVALLAGLVIFISGWHQPAPADQPLQPAGLNSSISGPASWEQLLDQAEQRKYPKFFSLGPEGNERFQVRIDLSTKGDGLQIGYLGAAAQKDFSPTNNPTFDYLIANQRFARRAARGIASAAGEKVTRPDFIVYFPGKDAERQDIFFAASKKNNLLATIVALQGNRQDLVQRLQLTRARE